MAPSINFPENLDITPSTLPRSHLTKNQLNIDVFGDSAQWDDAIHKYGIAGRVWEAAYALNLYADPPSSLEFDPPFIQDISQRLPLTILELGSGTGIVGSHIANVLSPFNDMLIVTDLPEVCPLLSNNLNTSGPQNSPQDLPMTNIYVRPLTWGNEEHCRHILTEFFVEPGVQMSRTLNKVICSDLVYFPELLAPLLRTLLQLTFPLHTHAKTTNETTVVISYKIRSLSKETPFWSAFGLWFEFEPVLVKENIPKGEWHRFSLDATFVFTARRRPESFSWKIPLDDEELLAGRGARGNDLVKEDDTFETLLFMALEET